MLVVLEVAAQAIALGVAEFGRRVAILAHHQRVLTSQGESGPIVVKTLHFPVLVGVATLALVSNLPLMFVILLVAADAEHGCIAHALDILVARLAFHAGCCVCIAQPKTSLVVLKAGRLPVLLSVAAPTLRSQIAGMLVVLLVAGIALLAGLLEHSAFVA